MVPEGSVRVGSHGVVATRLISAGEYVCAYNGTTVNSFADLSADDIWCINAYTKQIRIADMQCGDTAGARIACPETRTASPDSLASRVREKSRRNADSRVNVEIGFEFGVYAVRAIMCGELLCRDYGQEYQMLQTYLHATDPLVKLAVLYKMNIVYVHKNTVYLNCDSRDYRRLFAYLGIDPDGSYMRELGIPRDDDDETKIKRLISLLI